MKPKTATIVLLIYLVVHVLTLPTHASTPAIPSYSQWNSALTLPMTHSSSSKGPLKVGTGTAWDSNFLYFNVDVQGSNTNYTPSLNRDFSNGNHVAIYIASAGSAHSSPGSKPGKNDFIFIITPNNAFGDPMITTYGYGGHEHLSLNLRSISYQVQGTSNGYRMIVQVPWDLLGASPSPGHTIGLAVVVREVSADGLEGEVSSVLANPHYSPGEWLQYQLAP